MLLIHQQTAGDKVDLHPIALVGELYNEGKTCQTLANDASSQGRKNGSLNEHSESNLNVLRNLDDESEPQNRSQNVRKIVVQIGIIKIDEVVQGEKPQTR